ncbi:hypothetical protein ACET3Z_028094 [Daucus carota]
MGSTLHPDEDEKTAASFEAASGVAAAAEICDAAFHNPEGGGDYDKESHEFRRYLHSGFRDTPGRDLSSSFGFLHPATYIQNDEFNAYVVQRLREGVNRMNLMPFNYNLHWILVAIWESEIFILNSLPHYPHPDELEKALMRAVRAHNAELGRVIKNPKVKNLRWAARSRKTYSKADLDIVRLETLDYIQSIM